MIAIFVIAAIILLFVYFNNTGEKTHKTLSDHGDDGNQTKRIRKSNKTWGKFNVAGHYHLPDDVKRFVWKELKVGEGLRLMPDPNNQYDKHAIKVICRDKLIGWFPKDHDRKKEVFEALMEGINVEANCTINDRRQEYWNDKSLMTQFVEVKFVYWLK